MLTFKQLGEKRRAEVARREEQELRRKNAERKQQLAAERRERELLAPLRLPEWTGICSNGIF